MALKEIRLEREQRLPCTAIPEVSLLKDLKHANIIRLQDILYTEKSLTLAFEYLDKGLKQCMKPVGRSSTCIPNCVKLILFRLLWLPGFLPPAESATSRPQAPEPACQ